MSESESAIELLVGLLRGEYSAVAVEVRPGWRTFDAERDYVSLRVTPQRGEDPEADEPPPPWEAWVSRQALLDRLCEGRGRGRS